MTLETLLGCEHLKTLLAAYFNLNFSKESSMMKDTFSRAINGRIKNAKRLFSVVEVRRGFLE